MTLLGNFVRTREQGEQRMYWRSMNGMRSSSRTHSFLMKTLILASHASSAPFVPFERIMFFLSGHLYKISQQSHKSAPTDNSYTPVDGGTCLTVSPDLASKVSNDLRTISETLMRISRGLHEHVQKLERAVEGTYARESSDPRIRLLSDSLHLSRLADLELGRLSQSLQRVLQLVQGQTGVPAQQTAMGTATP